MHRTKTWSGFLCFIGAAAVTRTALAVVDVDAASVQLSKSCTQAGKPIDNCFTDLNALNQWIWNTRNPAPSAAAPLVVEIGPGRFVGQFTCADRGHVSLRGAGMGITFIESGGQPITTTNCVNLSFSEMTLRNTDNLFGVQNLGGSTVWQSVEIDGQGYAWFDTPTNCGTIKPGTHYWFGSRIRSRTAAGSATAYYNACDSSWLFGSEIISVGTSDQVVPLRVGGGDVHVYGSTIRATTGPGVNASEMGAVAVRSSGEAHIHGTGIDVLSSAGNHLVVLRASNGGVIHANQASYNLKTGSGGTITRISQDTNAATHVHAPYLWEQHPNPPNIQSVNGADMAVVTSTSDGHPHLVIYDASCASRWFDTVTRSCR